MIDFSKRHPGPELMDGTGIPDEDLFLNYKELDFINHWLGGYRITLKGLSKFISGRKEISVLDMGCGGGDMLKRVAIWGKGKNLKLHLTGIDLSEAAIEYSKKNCPAFSEIEFICEDVFQHLQSGKKYDVIMNTLFMHHFSDEQIVSLLELMNQSSIMGFVINDLQRNPVAYQSIRWLTKLFSKSYLVKHDAPMSVLRGFTRGEWERLFDKAQIGSVAINWQWAFRYLIMVKK